MYWHVELVLSENRVYSQWNSHFIGIMIINHWGLGVHYFQTHPIEFLTWTALRVCLSSNKSSKIPSQRGEECQHQAGLLVCGSWSHWWATCVSWIVIQSESLCWDTAAQIRCIESFFLRKDTLACLHCLPSGKQPHNYGNSPFFMVKSTINGHFQ